MRFALTYDDLKWFTKDDLRCDQVYTHTYTFLWGGWNSFGWLLRLRRPSIGHTTCPRWWIPMSSPSHRWDANSITWTPCRICKSIPISLFTLGWYVVLCGDSCISSSRCLCLCPLIFQFFSPHRVALLVSLSTSCPQDVLEIPKPEQPAKMNVLAFSDSVGYCKNFFANAPEGRISMKKVVENYHTLTQEDVKKLVTEPKKGWDLVVFAVGCDPPRSNSIEDVIEQNTVISRLCLVYKDLPAMILLAATSYWCVSNIHTGET